MKISTDNLLNDLRERTTFCLRKAEAFREYPLSAQNAKAAANRWSALECLEHLNRYGNFYLPELAKRIAESPHPASPTFTSGFIGDRFAKMLLPGTKKMSTFASMNPSGSQLSEQVVQTFIGQQQQLLQLLEKAHKVNLNKTKTSISISKLLKLRLGDTLRVVIYHNQRHILQAEAALAASKAAEQMA